MNKKHFIFIWQFLFSMGFLMIIIWSFSGKGEGTKTRAISVKTSENMADGIRDCSDVVYRIRIIPRKIRNNEGERSEKLEICVQNLGENALTDLVLSYEFSSQTVSAVWLPYRGERVEENQMLIRKIDPLKSYSVFLQVNIPEEYTDADRENSMLCFIYGKNKRKIQDDIHMDTIVNASVEILKTEG